VLPAVEEHPQHGVLPAQLCVHHVCCDVQQGVLRVVEWDAQVFVREVQEGDDQLGRQRLLGFEGPVRHFNPARLRRPQYGQPLSQQRFHVPVAGQGLVERVDRQEFRQVLLGRTRALLEEKSRVGVVQVEVYGL